GRSPERKRLRAGGGRSGQERDAAPAVRPPGGTLHLFGRGDDRCARGFAASARLGPVGRCRAAARGVERRRPGPGGRRQPVFRIRIPACFRRVHAGAAPATLRQGLGDPGLESRPVATFKAVLQPDPTGTGTFVVVPRRLSDELGLKGRPKIQAVIAGHPYRGSLMPMGDGTYCLGVLKSIQQAAGVKRGDTITVELAVDTALRTDDMPHDLAVLLAMVNNVGAEWVRL